MNSGFYLPKPGEHTLTYRATAEGAVEIGGVENLSIVLEGPMINAGMDDELMSRCQHAMSLAAETILAVMQDRLPPPDQALRRHVIDEAAFARLVHGQQVEFHNPREGARTGIILSVGHRQMVDSIMDAMIHHEQ